jgi:peroxiredoxin
MVLLFVLTACPKGPGSSVTGTRVGDKALNFTAKDQNNQNVSLYNYLGQVVLFNFSADWCGPCRTEATHLEALHQEYRARGVQVITILTSGSVSLWAQNYGLTFPVLNDNDESIWKEYGEGSVPLNVIMDRDGIIRYKRAGYYEAQIKNKIEEYL